MLETPDSVKYSNCLTVLSRCQKLFEIVPGLDYEPHPRHRQLPSSPTSSSSIALAPKRPGIPILIPQNDSRLVNPRWTLMAMGLFGAIIAPHLVEEYRKSLIKYARDTVSENPTKELDYLQTSPVMPRDPPSKDELQGNDAFSYKKWVVLSGSCCVIRNAQSLTFFLFSFLFFFLENRFLLDNMIASDLSTEGDRSLSTKHYIRAENRFVTALMEISRNLVAVPRESRRKCFFSFFVFLVLFSHRSCLC